ncbi:MAG TPA: class I SAM-dependent methyltransferase [Terriglobales bacterium]|nr:class I SAM-dependent methyltransferase [Terriglobales bacterium]
MATELSCRACGHAPLQVVLSLGKLPLANRLLTAAELGDPEPRFPLDWARCPACALVQITETVPPEILFRDYVYFSSYSDTMLRHAGELTARLIRERGLGPGSLVVEIASNDGYLLKGYAAAGIPVLGVEPARNVAQVAEANGIRTLAEFFDEALAGKLAAGYGRADVIHAHNVLAHVADLSGVVRGFRALLRDGGVAVVEVPYLRDLVDHGEFDTIYHEHLCYFSATALDRLLGRHGLVLRDVERVPIHGGSLRLFVGPAGSSGESVRRLLAEEADWGVDREEPLVAFAARVEEMRAALVELLGSLKRSGKSLAAYGAAAKGSTLLGYAGIGRETLDFVADRSPHKRGRHMPGVHVPIVSPARLVDERPDYCLLLAWNFAEEIMAQQSAYRAAGGRFIVPVPTPRIV